MKILDELQDGDNRIVTFEFKDDRKTIEVCEACDYYFSVDMNKEQFGRFIAELQALHAQMVDA